MIFSFDDYKSYMLDRFEEFPSRAYGARSKIAEHLGCQTSYVSRVLRGHAHFSLEQAVKVSEFFKHTDEEAHYFMLLVLESRAGTDLLRSYFKSQRSLILDERQNLSRRIGSLEISLEVQNVYYSSWVYAAVHCAISIPSLSSPTKIAAHLRLPEKKVNEVLTFLVSAALVNRDELGRLSLTSNHIHLGKTSSLIRQHHLNWRTKAMDSILVDNGAKAVHYSAVLGLSSADAEAVRARLTEVIVEMQRVAIQSEKSEEMQCLSLDFFSV